ncbi:zf-HC2 domain-containing protein [Pseudonocardia humida]|uniref:Zf-HC2 domain-containing protein n=1 Tax=Pseudonocardia humida TaxID=2800819 RepID=A0ABT1A0F4_9PSEU|nr:zf-HC2 domain-containing protein [Pseudonocardia humida]MCO1656468.1 zf-HC2 domain-containing protein [Pseudonocardia humida]
MGCDECREAISAQLDGEASADDEREVAAHLPGCPDCRSFADRAARVTRLTRTGVAEPGPDLAAAVLAAAPPPPRRRAETAVRSALYAVGVGQLALSLAAVVGAAGADHGGMAGASMAHMAHEGAAWNVALGVGFLWAASVRGDRLSGLVPLLSAFVAVLAALSALDLAAGRVAPERLATHLLAVAGLVLILLRRRGGPGRGGRRPRRRSERTTTGADPRRSELPRPDGPRGLRPTAHRPAA